jgi:hypothetical protein
MYGAEEKCIEVLNGKPEDRGPTEDPGTDWRILQKKWDGKVWKGLIWLRISVSDRL